VAASTSDAVLKLSTPRSLDCGHLDDRATPRTDCLPPAALTEAELKRAQDKARAAEEDLQRKEWERTKVRHHGS
jgi:hypothetical protein